jgi:hypothetical protein
MFVALLDAEIAAVRELQLRTRTPHACELLLLKCGSAAFTTGIACGAAITS